MKTLMIVTLIGLLAMADGCSSSSNPIGGGPCEATGPVVVYKTKKDYSNNVSVQLSDDKKTITAYPGPADAYKPAALANGYYLQKMLGNAFLSITIDQYRDSSGKYPFDQLQNYIIDSDPFTEYYELCTCATRDTFFLNRLILHDSLGKCNK